MELINALPKQITLGNQGESGITTIDVDCTAWLTDFPSGELAVTFIPPDQNQPKLLPNSQAYMLPDGTLHIIVKRNMTQYSGKGSLVIRLAVGDDTEKRSAVIGTYTAPSHATDADLMPADVEDWATEATQKLAEIMDRMGFVPKGDYDADTEYKHGDWVSANGGSYGYIWPEPSTGVPVTDTSHWQQIAEKGTTGDVTPEAEAARDDAVAAKNTAVIAKDEATAARDAAQGYKDDATAARDAAQGYKDDAAAARDAAQGYKDDAANSAAQLAAGPLRPKGTYANLSALNAGTPTVADTNEIYITLDDGKWCYHNGSAWVAGGVFQAASLVVKFLPSSANVTSDSVAVDGELLTYTPWSQYVATDYIPIKDLKTISIKSNDYVSRIIRYNSEKTRLGYLKSQTNGIYTYNVVPGANDVYCRVLLWKTSYEGFGVGTANTVWEFVKDITYDYIKAIYNKVVTPEMFGAVGDGVADDTDAVQAAVDSGKRVLLISRYAISDPITLHSASYVEGATFSKGLIQTDTTKDIIVIDRAYQSEYQGLVIKTMTLSWNGVAGADTVGIHFMQTSQSDGWGTHDSYIENIKIVYPYYGLKFDNNEPSWNNKIDIYCYGAQYQALRIHGGFGNEVNLKALGPTNNVSVTRTRCIYMYAGGKMRIDVEDWKHGVMITESVSTPIIIDLIHLERCDITNGGSYFQFSNTAVTINLLEAYNCQAHGSNASMFLLYGTDKNFGGCVLEVDVVILYDFIIDNTFYLVKNSGNYTTLCHIKSVQKAGTVNLNGVYYPYLTETAKENCLYKYKNAFE